MPEVRWHQAANEVLHTLPDSVAERLLQTTRLLSQFPTLGMRIQVLPRRDRRRRHGDRDRAAQHRRHAPVMSDPSSSVDPEQRFAAVVEALVDSPGVTFGPDEPGARNRFGSSALKIRGKIFAMLVRGALVVKLRRQRVDVLVAAGDGERFDPRHDGRVMKEWLAVGPAAADRWLALAREAMEFVGSRP